jgi:hypothetical protein
VKRNRILAEALSIDTEKKSLVQPVDFHFSEHVVEFGADNLGFVKEIEQIVTEFFNSEVQNYYFKPMKSRFRCIVHEVGLSFKMHTQSIDEEPKRSVFLRKTKDTSFPNIKLSQVCMNPLLNPAEVDEEEIEESRGTFPFNGICFESITEGFNGSCLMNYKDDFDLFVATEEQRFEIQTEKRDKDRYIRKIFKGDEEFEAGSWVIIYFDALEIGRLSRQLRRMKRSILKRGNIALSVRFCTFTERNGMEQIQDKRQITREIEKMKLDEGNIFEKLK